MARKTKAVVITAEGRDKGKTYVLTEMAAVPAEKWATRALLAMARGGIQIPAGIENLGFAGVAMMGFHVMMNARFEEVEPLLDEMLACVQIETSPGTMRAPHTEEDIEEVATLIQLRREVFELHAGFWWAVAKSKLDEAVAAGKIQKT